MELSDNSEKYQTRNTVYCLHPKDGYVRLSLINYEGNGSWYANYFDLETGNQYGNDYFNEADFTQKPAGKGGFTPR